MKLNASVLFVVLTFLACGRTDLLDADGQDAAPGSTCDDDELLRRWNAAVDAVGPTERDFHWRSVSDFPHPTYRRGDAIAYDTFTDVLIQFWGDPSNVEFATSCQLLDKQYASGPSVQRQLYVELRQVTRTMTTFSMVSPDRQRALTGPCAAIHCR